MFTHLGLCLATTLLRAVVMVGITIIRLSLFCNESINGRLFTKESKGPIINEGVVKNNTHKLRIALSLK